MLPEFRRDVEGLRAVAVTMVVLYHFRLVPLPGGFVGVDVFFVISGYLITGLLVSEAAATGAIDLVQFYSRRARRLLPALVLMTLCTLVASLALFSPAELKEVAKSGAAAAAYVSNLWFASRSFDYFAPEAGLSPFLHTWSLGIEEQFYLAWPALLLLFAAGTRANLVVFLGLVAAASFAASVLLTETRQPLAFYLPFTRAWEFALGGLMYAVWKPGATLAAWLGGAGLLGIGLCMVLVSENMPFPGWIALLPVLCTCALLKAGEASNPVSTVLSGSAPVEIGRLSYSIYLWHWPVLVLAQVRWPDMDGAARALCFALAIACAAISFYLIEDPVRTTPRLSFPRRRAVLLWAGLTSGGVLLSAATWTLAWRDAQHAEQVAVVAAAAEFSHVTRDPRGCIADLLREDPLRCVYGVPFATGEIVLVGDSHAVQWFTPVERFARANGLSLTTYLKSSCAVADVPVFSVRLRRENKECAAWRERTLGEIAARRPRLVVVGQHSFSYVRRDDTPNGPAQTSRPEEWEAGLVRSLRRLGGSGAQVVLLADTPLMGFHVPNCLGRGPRPLGRAAECSRPERDAVNGQVTRAEQAAAARSGARYVNLQKFFCDSGACGPLKGGQILYRDAHHVSESYARHLSEEMGSMLQFALQSAGSTP